MNKLLKMQLYSKDGITAEGARKQIEALSAFENGLFRPQKCDTAEPIRERFDPSDISEPVRWLMQPGADFQFKSSMPYKSEGFISNRRYPPMWTKEKPGGALIPIEPKYPEPYFLSSWTMWIDSAVLRKLGADLLIRFAVEMFLSSRSEYGFLASENDQKAKNFLVTNLPSGATSSKFVGTDPERGIPGLYWLNLFGPKYAKWLGPQIKDIPSVVVPIKGGGVSLMFGTCPQESEMAEALMQQKKAIAALGPEKFFDIRDPERKPASPFAELIGG
jgi:hypothetical protein